MAATDTEHTLWPLDDKGRASIEGVIGQIEAVSAAIGEGWTSKGDFRQTGLSLHLKFEQRTDAHIAMDLGAVLEKSPGMLLDACRRLLAAMDASCDCDHLGCGCSREEI